VTAPLACPSCRKRFVPVDSPLCTVCGEPFKSREGADHHCQRCLEAERHYDSARACGIYDETLRALIHWFKYKDSPQLARPLGHLLAWGFRRHYAAERIDLVIPVPLHRRRFRRRGFNQAYLLARQGLGRQASGSKERLAGPVARSLLVRTRRTLPQTGLDRTQRAQNLRRAFALVRPQAVEGRNILIVDDVFTTGATVNECARVLKRAGAGRVDVLTLARAL
jgi:ComF family protein